MNRVRRLGQQFSISNQDQSHLLNHIESRDNSLVDGESERVLVVSKKSINYLPNCLPLQGCQRQYCFTHLSFLIALLQINWWHVLDAPNPFPPFDSIATLLLYRCALQAYRYIVLSCSFPLGLNSSLHICPRACPRTELSIDPSVATISRGR